MPSIEVRLAQDNLHSIPSLGQLSRWRPSFCGVDYL